MSNDFYNPTGNPGPRASGSSATMRAEFTAAQAGFDKLLGLVGKALQIPRVNAGETAQEGIPLTYGSYTPAPVSMVNMTVAPTMYQSNWIRLGNMVVMTGHFLNSANVVTGQASFEFDLPVPTTLSNDAVVAGVVTEVTEEYNWHVAIGSSNRGKFRSPTLYGISSGNNVYLLAYPVV